MYVEIKLASERLGLLFSQSGRYWLFLQRKQLTCTVCVCVCVCVWWITCHKEGKVGFLQREPLPRSIANFTVNNFTRFFWAKRTESRVSLAQKERVYYPAGSNRYTVRRYWFGFQNSILSYRDCWIVQGQVDRLYDTFGTEKVLDESVHLQRGCRILLREGEVIAFCQAYVGQKQRVQKTDRQTDGQTQYRFLSCLSSTTCKRNRFRVGYLYLYKHII